MKNKILGWIILIFAIAGFLLVIGGRIYYKDFHNFNPVPFVLAIIFLIVWSRSLIKNEPLF